MEQCQEIRAIARVSSAEGDGRTFGEMSQAEKHAISHRGRSLRSLLTQLEG